MGIRQIGGSNTDVRAIYIDQFTFTIAIPEEPPVFIGDRGIYFAGWTGSEEDGIDYVTISTPGNATNFGNAVVGRYFCAGLSNGGTQRGIFTGISAASYNTDLDYITINNPSNAADFGDMTDAQFGGGAASNGTNDRGLFVGGKTSGLRRTDIDYVTISTTGNATDSGFDLLQPKTLEDGCCSNSTNERAVWMGGRNNSALINEIGYNTISTLSNATNFGDLTWARRYGAGADNGTNERGVYMAGEIVGTSYVDIIEYITINSPSNATNFGDTTVARWRTGGCSNKENERGLCMGGYNGSFLDVIDYIAINSAGDATDFGDLVFGRSAGAGTSDS